MGGWESTKKGTRTPSKIGVMRKKWLEGTTYFDTIINVPVRIFKVGNRVVFEPALAYKGPMHPALRLCYTQGVFRGGLNTHT